MTSSALILSVYCGVSLSFRIIELIFAARTHLSISIKSMFHKFGSYELLLFIVCVAFLIAAIYDRSGGRFLLCTGFDIHFGLSYILESIKSLRNGFYIVFALSFCALCVLAWKKPYIRYMLLLHSVYIALLWLAYLLIVSKCGAKYYLMSGALLSTLLILCVWIGVICKESGKKTLAVAGFIAVVAWLHPFEGYKERPRDGYMIHRDYAKSWVAQVREAEASGKDSITIVVPRELPHWQWWWFFPDVGRMLRQFGVIRHDIAVRFEPEPVEKSSKP